MAPRDLGFRQEMRWAPVILQPYIDKAYEVRATVIGEKVFAAAIFSQSSTRTTYDWRRYNVKHTPHKPFKLSPEVEERCISMVRHLGLVFGAIDLICTPDNRFVFLEINPNGQWAWIEILTGLPIGDAIADWLVDSDLGARCVQ
jgi:glutathione synthase/RimK-type ligase-like ATP-grasp enzyme